MQAEDAILQSIYVLLVYKADFPTSLTANCLTSDVSPRPRVSLREAQLSQRGLAMHCVIEYFAKSLKITQGRWKLQHSIDRIRVIINKYDPILYHFRDKARN